MKWLPTFVHTLLLIIRIALIVLMSDVLFENSLFSYLDHVYGYDVFTILLHIFW